MPRNRLILFLCAALGLLLVTGSILGALIRLINELRYSLEYFLPYWIVNPFLLIISLLLITLIVQVGWPWWKSFFNKKIDKSNRKPNTKFNLQSRRQAAKKSLESIDRVLEKIQDNVTREGLKHEKDQVALELARGDLVVVIFGTGSSGKTSLIRALLKEIVGEVGPSMGSTTSSQVYKLRLKGLNRSLKLIDTPGILESGKSGQRREKEARIKASHADLMIFVIDSDLRSAELEAIQGLANLGKRLLLVLNKCDLRGEQEAKKLLLLLKNHC